MCRIFAAEMTRIGDAARMINAVKAHNVLCTCAWCDGVYFVYCTVGFVHDVRQCSGRDWREVE